jgi:hypothetical protein
MLKKLSINLLIFLSLSFTFLSGWNEKQTHLDHASEYKSNWGNLFIEGYEIDLKAAEFANKRLRGGYYDQNLHVVIPADFSETNLEWKKAKDYIAYRIGPIPTLFTKDRILPWENSAKNVDELLQDAHAISASFKKDFQYIASVTGTVVHFGPNDQNIVKTRESLIRKVQQGIRQHHVSESEAVGDIPDAIRGTIIVDHLLKIPSVISEIINYVDYRGSQVIFRNIWMENRETGYVGIHAKILLPLPKPEGLAEQRNILAEIQIHLLAIEDGTKESAKERQHLIYERVRSEDTEQPKLSAASKLLYLTAMQDVIHSLQKSN